MRLDRGIAVFALCATGCFPTYDFTAGDDAGSEGAPDAAIDRTVPADGASDARLDTSSATDTSAPGDAGADASDARADTGGGGACAGNPGTTAMARFDTDAGSFCIDVAEVTQGQLNEFIAAAPPPSWTLEPICRSMNPDGGGPENFPAPESGRDGLPAHRVSWCTAWAYCRWAGKRLCGRIGGGHDDGAGAGQNEWVHACQNGALATKYPYGAAFALGRCNTGEVDAGQSFAPGTFADCHGLDAGGASDIVDMVGNVEEYTDIANDHTTVITDGTVVAVNARGGGYEDDDALSDCHVTTGQLGQYNGAAPDLGFRCCADAR